MTQRVVLVLLVLTLVLGMSAGVANATTENERNDMNQRIGIWDFEESHLEDSYVAAVQEFYDRSSFPWELLVTKPIRVVVREKGGTFTGYTAIVINKNQWYTPEDFAWSLLHETGHIVDNRLLTAADHAELLEQKTALSWRAASLPHDERPEEMFARTFVTLYCPTPFVLGENVFTKKSVSDIIQRLVALPKPSIGYDVYFPPAGETPTPPSPVVETARTLEGLVAAVTQWWNDTEGT